MEYGHACQYTRPELEKLLADSGFGSNAMMFNMYFRANPAGAGPPLCATCGNQIGMHGAAAVATIVAPGGIDVNMPPADIQPCATDPMIERTPDSECKPNPWWMLLLHPGIIPFMFSWHKTHMEFRHATRTAAYVKDWVCCPCTTETTLQYDEVPVPEVDITQGKHGRFAHIRVRGPGTACCDADCGYWRLSTTDPFDTAKQQAHKTQWTNYIVRSHHRFANAPPLGPSPGAAPVGVPMGGGAPGGAAAPVQYPKAGAFAV